LKKKILVNYGPLELHYEYENKICTIFSYLKNAKEEEKTVSEVSLKFSIPNNLTNFDDLANFLGSDVQDYSIEEVFLEAFMSSMRKQEFSLPDHWFGIAKNACYLGWSSVLTEIFKCSLSMNEQEINSLYDITVTCGFDNMVLIVITQQQKIDQSRNNFKSPRTPRQIEQKQKLKKKNNTLQKTRQNNRRN